MNARVSAVTMTVLLVTSLATADTFHSLLQYDLNNDGRLSKDELTAYFKDQKADDPVDSANDILTAFACQDCTSISIKTAAMVLGEKPAAKKPESKVRPCDLFTIKRTVSDDPNPRAPENDFPAIFSYLRDKHADDTDQLNILGAVQPIDCAWNAGDPTLLNVTYGAGVGVDFDVDGTKKANENKIEGSLPLFWRWVSVHSAAPVSGLGITVTPKFSTDRALDREVWEVASKVSVRSRALLRAGIMTNIRGSSGTGFSFWWAPVLQYEAGNVRDPAGNQDLEKLKGSYRRFAPRVDAIIWPRFLNDRIAVKSNITERFGVAGKRHSYLESIATYDLTVSGSVGLTTVFRHGRKPPDFSAKDQWLVGIGIQR